VGADDGDRRHPRDDRRGPLDRSKREAGVDLIAIIAIIGCLALHEYAAGAVIAVMLASGQALEDYADRRAHRELSDLLARAPRQVHRYENGGLETRTSTRSFWATGCS
jgi:cation transport ATPase